MAHFFIDRPIFAWVIAILIMMAGALSITTLPIAQYPNIAPPEIAITAFYPGASAKTVEDSVTQVIEQQMKGLDHLNYMYSNSDSMGNATVNLSFQPGTDPDIAQVQVQNKLQLATPLLPQAVQRQGMAVKKSAKNYLLVVAFVSEDGSLSRGDIADYVASNVMDPISRVDGVGEVTLFGAQYAMRIWCNLDMFQKYQLTPSDVSNAINNQNAQIAAGQLGGPPSVSGQTINITVNAQSRLETVKQFENILVKVNQDGSTVLLKDVARVELGPENYNSDSRYSYFGKNGQAILGKPAAGLALRLASGANALSTVDGVKAALAKMSPFFPKSVIVAYPYDTSPFVRISIKEVFKTLIEAIVLVFLVMYIFLQNFRATLIPTIAVPVVLLGTFGVLAASGFSINTLTMFGMVLAIGLLVDDAIVVVENVERLMREEHLSPRDATRKSMTQITGALVGIAMVLSAVFIPMAFFGGSTGVIYRQFSITIVSAMALSVLVALILTPALCATILKEHDPSGHKGSYGVFGWFNRMMDKGTRGYQNSVAGILNRRALFLLFYVGIVGGMAYLFLRLPSSFLPEEDQGIMYAQIQLPAGATFERTNEVISKVEDHFMKDEKDAVSGIMCVSGFSFSGNGQNNGMCFIKLRDWEERSSDNLRVPALAGRAMRKFSQINTASVLAFGPPAVIELGSASGFDFELTDQANMGHAALMQARNTLLREARQNPNLVRVRHNGLEDTPQYQLDIDMAKAGALGLSVGEINTAVSTYWGSSYVNDFMDRGRIKKVYMQADAPFRMQAEDFSKIFLRNAEGKMVPFSAIAPGTGHWVYGSPRLERYNGVSSVEILGEAAPGQSSGQAMTIMEDLAKKLPSGFGFSWTALSQQERLAGAQGPALYAISLLVVFLCLAALYESWAIPFSVMLVVPIGVLGCLGGAFLRGLQNDVYFQVGLLVIIGLSAKNAILIVEFAKELEEKGVELVAATLEAVRLRLRPILMTSLAFILGVLPLAISRGAGSGSQNAIGTGVMGGMITATVLGIFFIPLFFVVVCTLFRVQVKHHSAEAEQSAQHAE